MHTRRRTGPVALPEPRQPGRPAGGVAAGTRAPGQRGWHLEAGLGEVGRLGDERHRRVVREGGREGAVVRFG